MIVTRGNLLTWQAEQTSEGSWLPGIWSTLLLFALVAVLLLALGQGGHQAAAPDRAPTLCEEHAGRPGWAAVCENEQPGR